mgnify:FL=1|tara:strand:+ start:244 stop:903 length:660 start_codon:yes stop_codon:yes gene_type:complete
MNTVSKIADDLQEQGCSDHLVDQVRNAKEFSVEELDRISKALWKDQLPMDDKHEQWCQELAKRLIAVADMFDDGEDVIILAKLADQFPRMFEKMADNVVNQASDKKNEVRAAYRADSGIEITQNRKNDIEEGIRRLRRQWWTLNEAFKVCLDRVRPKIISNAGFSFNGGKYTKLKDLPRVQRMQAKGKKITQEMYDNDPEYCIQLLRDTGHVELPADQI